MVDVMEFRVLGPLRVEDAGTEFPLGGPKQRTVLALLVAAAGAPVSMDALLMGVYGPDAAPSSRRTLHTYISRYRSAFGDVIQRRGDDYALAVDPTSIDAVRFEDSVERAKSLVDVSESAEVLRSALGLWRGRPYADVDAAVLEAEARRLEALRAEAIEARVALELAAGRHRELVAELEVLVAQHPEREQLRADHMLALYRCGRQGDALRAYRGAVDYLREELGLDPSPELQRLEQQILSQDSALDFRPRPRHRSLPARYTSFVGRTAELASVERLVEEHRLVTITGPGGVGKSSLAVEAARSFTDRMAVVFVPIEAERQERPALLIARSLGLQPTNDADLHAMIAATLGDDSVLVLLNGCEHIIGDLPAVIAELLHRSPQMRILVTSREALFMTGEQRLVLEPFPVGVDSPATRLFLDRAAIPGRELDEKTSSNAARIAADVSGLPLGIELAAARHRTMSLDEIASQLDNQLQLLATKRGPQRRHLSIVAALDWSYRLLDDHQQHTFRQLAVFPTGMIPVDGAAVVLGTDSPTRLLHDLVDLSLLSPPDDEGGSFRILEPIRQYAAMRLDEAGERVPAERRHAQWLVELARGMQHLALMGCAHRAFPLLRAQAPAMAAATSWAIEHEEPDIVLELVAAVGRLWPRVADPRTLREPAMEIVERFETPLNDVAVAALATTAFLYRLDQPDVAERLGKRLEAELQHITDPATLAIVNEVLAVIPIGRHAVTPEQAASCLARWRTSVDLLVQLGYAAEPQYRNGAVLLDLLGQFDDAEDLLHRMLDFADDSRPVVRGLALEMLSDYSLLLRSDHQAALAACQEAARLLIDGGDLDYAAEAQMRQAWTHTLADQYDQAEEALRHHDEYHALIGLPPASEAHPLLVASIAAGLNRWDQFAATMRAFFMATPAPNDADYEAFLIGEPTTGAHFVHMIEPLARWLISLDRPNAAADLIAAAPMAFDATAFIAWEQVGDVARANRLAEELTDITSTDPLTSLDQLYRYMIECTTRN
jgi:predicted ATPase